MPTIQDSRILIKSSTVASQVPTIPASNDHTDGTWLGTDIYKGEIFINQIDAKVYTRTQSGIVQIYPQVLSDITEQYWITAEPNPDDSLYHKIKVTMGTDGEFQKEDLGPI